MLNGNPAKDTLTLVTLLVLTVTPFPSRIGDHSYLVWISEDFIMPGHVERGNVKLSLCMTTSLVARSTAVCCASGCRRL